MNNKNRVDNLEATVTNISPSFEVKDDRFDVSQIADCHLLIEAGHDRFRFAVYNTIHEVVMWLEDYHVFSLFKHSQLLATVKQIYKNHPFLSANYWKSIRLTVSTNHFTLIPDELYQPDDMAKYLNFAAGKNLSELEQAFEFKHGHSGIVNVFSVEKELVNWLKEMYPAKKITPQPLLSTLIEGSIKDKTNTGLHLYFEENYVSVVYFQDARLHFCNRLQYRTAQDMVYYVMFIMNELTLDADVPVRFYGEITTFSEGFVLLNKTFKNIEFAANPSRIKFSQYFEEMPEHRYYTLFCSYYLY
ncbi:DUF3822 family protein [Emticicia fluvialis]|uniref:DUF3822 family protein n=1 Tax=Emticicia fluvialis TaxID=2974474 RepID=UPI0021650712|nr:DUF3822 family protein [Emticicia fluvialis]